MFLFSRRYAHLFIVVVLSLLCTTMVSAHFKLNLNVRVLHVEHLSDGLRVYMRLPMPYLVANLLGEADEQGLPSPAPYTSNRLENDQLVHYIDAAQLKHSMDALAVLANQGLQLSVDGQDLNAATEGIRIYKNGEQPGFATLEDAKNAFQKEPSFKSFEQDVYVGDATVDVELRYFHDSTIYNYALTSTLNPGLPDQDGTANLVLDYSPSGAQVFRTRGLMSEPITVTRSVFDAVTTFVKEGVRHILEGVDHVLFVICLVLGAMQLKPLLWRVTGFTIGHSITLSLGFLGFVPSAVWFIPAVETGIALSIIYVAIVAVLPDFSAGRELENTGWSVVAVTGLIGLLHGLGFSFVLQNILQVTSPDIWQSLLAFNLGVEIGQLSIVLATLSVFFLIGRFGTRATQVSRYLIAGGCAAISLVWVIERGNSIIKII